MIYDVKENLFQYRGLEKNIDHAVDYLLDTDFSRMKAGRYPIDGEKVIALVQTLKTRCHELTRWESHKKYIDIQYMLVGSKIIGFENTHHLEESVAYSADNDIMFYRDSGKGFFPLLVSGPFVICFPWDAHMPLICADHPQKIKKVVIKVETERRGES